MRNESPRERLKKLLPPSLILAVGLLAQGCASKPSYESVPVLMPPTQCGTDQISQIVTNIIKSEVSIDSKSSFEFILPNSNSKILFCHVNIRSDESHTIVLVQDEMGMKYLLKDMPNHLSLDESLAFIKNLNIKKENSFTPSKVVQNDTPDEVQMSSADFYFQDAEFVLGHADIGFDTGDFLQKYDATSLLPIIETISTQFSVSTKMLLAFLEKNSQLTNFSSNEAEALRIQLTIMAVELNEGYYNKKTKGINTISFPSGQTIQKPDLNAGTFALMNYVAKYSTDESDLHTRLQSFFATYQNLFGQNELFADPTADLELPDFKLPFSSEETWYFTGGPHGAWGVTSAWGALDFAPKDTRPCSIVVPSWNLAITDGKVMYSDTGLVLVDRDKDNDLKTGLVVGYLHVNTKDRVPVGTFVEQGDRIGHPSCEGGRADGAHVHLFAKNNGEFISVEKLVIDRWTFTPGAQEYYGSMQNSSGEKRLPSATYGISEAVVKSTNDPR